VLRAAVRIFDRSVPPRPPLPRVGPGLLYAGSAAPALRVAFGIFRGGFSAWAAGVFFSAFFFFFFISPADAVFFFAKKFGPLDGRPAVRCPGKTVKFPSVLVRCCFNVFPSRPRKAWISGPWVPVRGGAGIVTIFTNFAHCSGTCFFFGALFCLWSRGTNIWGVRWAPVN